MEYLRLGKNIIIADLHIGIELEYASKGIFIPWQVDKLKRKISKIVEKEKGATRLIINGDLKHSILRIDYKEIKYLFSFVNFVEDLFDEVIIVKGNHDGKLQKILKGRNVVNFFVEKKTLVLHGHKRIPDKDWKGRIIIGHIHPIFKVNHEVKKVFVHGVYNDSEVIILPAFSDLAGGRDPRDGMKGPIARKLRDVKVISLDGYLLHEIRNFFKGKETRKKS